MYVRKIEEIEQISYKDANVKYWEYLGKIKSVVLAVNSGNMCHMNEPGHSREHNRPVISRCYKNSKVCPGQFNIYLALPTSPDMKSTMSAWYKF